MQLNERMNPLAKILRVRLSPRNWGRRHQARSWRAAWKVLKGPQVLLAKSSMVPGTGIEPVRPLRDSGF